MRFGLLLLSIGFVFCLSIAWAAPGFLLMGAGLLCMLIAERRKRVPKAPSIDQSDAPPIEVRGAQIFAKRPADPSFDVRDWQTLVEHDPDLARIVDVLALYGNNYVDQFAHMYLARRDKTLLPIIIDKIIEIAAKDSGKEVSAAPAASGTSSGAKSATESAKATQQSRDASLRAIYEIALDSQRSNPTALALSRTSAPIFNNVKDAVPKAPAANGATSPRMSADVESHLDAGLSDWLDRLEPNPARRRRN